MTAHNLGLLIGGLLPALLFGVSNLFVKSSTNAGISSSFYLMVVGVAVFMTGGLLYTISPDRAVNLTSGSYAFAAGMLWAFGIMCVTLALQKYDAPIGELTPLFNMNTLITVLLALWVFSEWKEVSMPKLMLGAFLIVAGGALVAKA